MIFTIGGVFTSDVFKYLKLEVTKCKDSESNSDWTYECLSDEEISKIFRKFYHIKF